jgi:hypothetical protein
MRADHLPVLFFTLFHFYVLKVIIACNVKSFSSITKASHSKISSVIVIITSYKSND